MEFTLRDSWVNEGAGTHHVQLRLSSSLPHDLKIKYKATSPETTSGSDFEALSGKVTVPAGETTAAIPVTIIDDGNYEVNERLWLALVDGVGYRLGVLETQDHIVHIIDNEQRSVVAFSSSRTQLEEGAGTHNVTLNLTPAPSSNITVRYSVGDVRQRPGYLRTDSATPDSDYQRLSGTVTVLAGATTATIPVTLIDDGAHERSEALSLRLDYGTRYTWAKNSRNHRIVITDDDPRIDVSFATASQKAVEGAGTRDVTVNLSSAPNADITLDYTVGGTATADADYTALSGSVTVSAGATTATIPVTILDDSIPEADETVVLTLTGAEGHRLVNPKTHTLTIAGSDAPPKMTMASFAEEWQDVVEGSGTRDVTVNLNPPPASPITLEYTVGGTATPDSDYTALSGTLSVSAGATTATIPVTILADNVREDFETVVLTLSPGTGYEPSTGTHRLIIVDVRPGVPLARFASLSQRVFEGAGTRDLTVNLNPPPTSNITLGYTVGGTATPDTDYTALSGTVTVSAGATTATIPVTITDDSDPEGEETVVLTLTERAGYRVDPSLSIYTLWPSKHTLTIAASDGVTAASFATASQRAGGETGTHDVTVNLDPAPASPITLNYTVGGTATPGSDYTTLLGTLAVSAGSAMATIPVTLLADSVQEDPETVVLTLAAGTGYELASPGTHTLTFGTVPTVTFPTLVRATSESVGTYRVPVHLSPPAPSGGITIYYSVDNKSGDQPPATPGDDYQPLSGELSVPAGASKAYIPVTIIDDSVEDSGETVKLELTDEPGYRVGSRYGEFSLYITNHESGDLEGRVQARLDAAVADGDGASANLWRRALAAMRGEAPPSGLARLTQADAQAQAASHLGSDIELALLWSEIAEAVGSGVTDPPASQVPEVTIAAGTDVTEGTAASFTLTANPAPAAALDVTVTVVTDGDYGIAAGAQTVTVPTTGSYTLTLATTGDEVDEADGSVSVTVDDGDGYTVGSSSSGSVAIADDDAPVLPAGHPLVKYASLVADIRDVYIVDHDNDSAHPKWKRVLKGLGDADYAAYPEPAMTAAEATDLYETHGWSRWAPVGAALAYAEQYFSGTTTPPPAAGPEVTIAAGAGVTEGTAATFTLTADPAPSAPLEVGVTVATDGNYGITAGTRTVTIPTTGSATLTLATAGDEADEADGSVTVTVDAGTGYTVGSASSGTVAIADDDVPGPEVTIAAGSGVTEGTAASFTLTATPAPSAALDVTVTVATDGDYGITAGTQTVTIPTSGSATLTLATTGDEADEADGSVSVTVDAGTGYTVGSASSGSVAIEDDDDPAPETGTAHPAVDPALIAQIREWMAAPGANVAARNERFTRVLAAFGVESHANPMTVAEAAYGLPVFGDRFTGSPHVGLGLTTGSRDYSLGWRLTPEAATAPDFSFGLKATLRESDTAEAEHTVGIEVRARW